MCNRQQMQAWPSALIEKAWAPVLRVARRVSLTTVDQLMQQQQQPTMKTPLINCGSMTIWESQWQGELSDQRIISWKMQLKADHFSQVVSCTFSSGLIALFFCFMWWGGDFQPGPCIYYTPRESNSLTTKTGMGRRRASGSCTICNPFISSKELQTRRERCANCSRAGNG